MTHNIRILSWTCRQSWCWWDRNQSDGDANPLLSTDRTAYTNLMGDISCNHISSNFWWDRIKIWWQNEGVLLESNVDSCIILWEYRAERTRFNDGKIIWLSTLYSQPTYCEYLIYTRRAEINVHMPSYRYTYPVANN